MFIMPGCDAGRTVDHFAALGLMPHRLIHQYQGKHGFTDRRCAQSDARVVPAGGDDFHRVTVFINAFNRQTQA